MLYNKVNNERKCIATKINIYFLYYDITNIHRSRKRQAKMAISCMLGEGRYENLRGIRSV